MRTNRWDRAGPSRFPKCYLLNVESPEFGLVVGVDAETAVTRRIAVVPSVRHYRWDDPGAQFSVAVGGQWRF